jgi:hypothetical protein
MMKLKVEPIERPALGTLKVGDPVLLIEPSYRRSTDDRYIPATVVKIARVWVAIQPEPNEGYARAERRMRLDTQDDGSNSNYRERFVTPEQRAYDERMTAARQTLTNVGIRFDYHSPFWRDDAATLALAEKVLELISDED